jgi:hypothetical protein
MFEDLNLEMFKLTDLSNSEMQFAKLQSSSIVYRFKSRVRNNWARSING